MDLAARDAAAIDRLEVQFEQLDLPVGNPLFRLGTALRITSRPLFTDGELDETTELFSERLERDPELHSWNTKLKEEIGPLAEIIKGMRLPKGDDFRTELNVITIGPAQFITIPGELYPELALGGIQDPQDPGADFSGASPEPPLIEMMHGKYKFIVGLANDELGYILPKSQWDVAPPYTYGAEKAPYGEIFSVGPETAGRIAEAYSELLGDARRSAKTSGTGAP